MTDLTSRWSISDRSGEFSTPKAPVQEMNLERFAAKAAFIREHHKSIHDGTADEKTIRMFDDI